MTDDFVIAQQQPPQPRPPRRRSNPQPPQPQPRTLAGADSMEELGRELSHLSTTDQSPQQERQVVAGWGDAPNSDTNAPAPPPPTDPPTGKPRAPRRRRLFSSKETGAGGGAGEEDNTGANTREGGSAGSRRAKVTTLDGEPRRPSVSRAPAPATTANEDDDGIREIPDIPDIDATNGDTGADGPVAAPPSIRPNRFKTIAELENELGDRGAEFDPTDIDLSLLISTALTPIDGTREDDRHWEFDHLFAQLSSELRADLDLARALSSSAADIASSSTATAPAAAIAAGRRRSSLAGVGGITADIATGFFGELRTREKAALLAVDGSERAPVVV